MVSSMNRDTLLNALTTVGEALAGQVAPTLGGSVTWAVEPDSSGGGKLTMTFTPTGGDPQVRVWRLSPVGGLPVAPLVVSQGSQLESAGSQPTNANTSQTGTATSGTLVDVGLGIKLKLPI